jgi:hypothetical protein
MNSRTALEGDDAQAQPDQPIVFVNTFTPKPGRLEEFIRTQAAEAARLGDAARAMG